MLALGSEIFTWTYTYIATLNVWLNTVFVKRNAQLIYYFLVAPLVEGDQIDWVHIWECENQYLLGYWKKPRNKETQSSKTKRPVLETSTGLIRDEKTQQYAF